MKQHIKHILVAICFIFAGQSLWAQQQFEGKWIDEDKTGIIIVSVENNQLVAKLVHSTLWEGDENILDKKNKDKSLRTRKVKGINILRSHTFNTDDQVWEDGEIYAFKHGDWYSCELKEKDGALYLTAYVGFTWLGKTVRWDKYEGDKIW